MLILKRFVSIIYMLGYVAYVATAGAMAWSKMNWPDWLSDFLVQSGWYGAFWPYYFPSLLGFKWPW
jgi:hypothetical protein